MSWNEITVYYIDSETFQLNAFITKTRDDIIRYRAKFEEAYLMIFESYNTRFEICNNMQINRKYAIYVKKYPQIMRNMQLHAHCTNDV